MQCIDKRTEVMTVAMELLAENGFHRVPMSMIAARANVAVGTIYLYFAGKDELITELFKEVENKIATMVREGFPTEGPIRERFLYLTGKILRFLIDNPLSFRYIEQFMNSPYGISMRRDRFLDKTGRNDFFMALFEEAIADRVVKDIPVIALFSLTIAPLIFLVRDHILGFVTLDEALIRQTTEACWDAIKR
ncbi:MAG: TetR family transcriptional regulator [Syntrophales bacterium]|jgi:AcrR family transcriptional regulator|nr:TetR family transcriptional regulator [Syntrophales bacterium]MCK9392227.1 TetR family transcriptional regulator [Syntrophales bacterium]